MHYRQKVILLIDEYDVPLAKAFEGGYYDEMAMLIRILFEQGLKSNDHLYFAVLTGCLRITKESIFTGLNNLKILSVTTPRLDEYFGFTDSEVRQLLEYYGLSDFYPVFHDWYDGYHFGNTDIYCPWDVICYCDALMADREAQPEAYWSNTSGNEIIRHFLELANSSAKREIEALIAGESIQKELRQELTYKELYDSIENVWSVLFSTGYLTLKRPGDTPARELVIPNTEIRNIFKSQILAWFQDSARRDGRTLNAFCEAFRQGNAREAERLFQAYLRRTISIRDAYSGRKENFYHGILVGLLSFKETWGVFSNHEARDGYSDILVEIDEDGIGIVIEVKYAGENLRGRNLPSPLLHLPNLHQPYILYRPALLKKLPFRDIHRMVSDPFQILGYHQNVKAFIHRKGFLILSAFPEHPHQIILHLGEQLVHHIVVTDHFLCRFSIPSRKGVDSIVHDLLRHAQHSGDVPGICLQLTIL